MQLCDSASPLRLGPSFISQAVLYALTTWHVTSTFTSNMAELLLNTVEFFGKVGEVIDHTLTAWGSEKMVRWRAGMQENKNSEMVTITDRQAIHVLNFLIVCP